MKKLGIGMFCVALCVAVALMFPQIGGSWQSTDEGCLDCHDFGSGPGDNLHSESGHSNCTSCHESVPDTPTTDTCIVCHPIGDTGKCPLVNFHDPDMGADCLMCHDTECGEPEDTTTTTEPEDTSTTTTEPAEDTTTTTEPVEDTTTTTEGSTCCLVKIYGEGSDEVAILRYMRDNVLSKSSQGREIVRLYYLWSPVIAKAAQNDEEFREKLKTLVDGILISIVEE